MSSGTNQQPNQSHQLKNETQSITHIPEGYTEQQVILRLSEQVAQLQNALMIEKQWRYSNGGSDVKWIPAQKYDDLLINNSYLVEKVIILEKQVKRLVTQGAGALEQEVIDLDSSGDERNEVNKLRVKPESLTQPLVKSEGTLSSSGPMKVESSAMTIPKPIRHAPALTSSQIFHAKKKEIPKLKTAPSQTSSTAPRTMLFQGSSIDKDKVRKKLNQLNDIQQTAVLSPVSSLTQSRPKPSATTTAAAFTKPGLPPTPPRVKSPDEEDDKERDFRFDGLNRMKPSPLASTTLQSNRRLFSLDNNINNSTNIEVSSYHTNNKTPNSESTPIPQDELVSHSRKSTLGTWYTLPKPLKTSNTAQTNRNASKSNIFSLNKSKGDKLEEKPISDRLDTLSGNSKTSASASGALSKSLRFGITTSTLDRLKQSPSQTTSTVSRMPRSSPLLTQHSSFKSKEKPTNKKRVSGPRANIIEMRKRQKQLNDNNDQDSDGDHRIMEIGNSSEDDDVNDEGNRKI